MDTNNTKPKYRKYYIFLGILIVLSPLGLLLPDFFKAGDAWGEWSVETVKELTGHEPEGMKKDAVLYSAPIPDYNPGKEDDSLSKKSVGYILSGIVGVGVIIVLTFGATKLFKHKQTE
jgi:cobalt/nickel transport protein